jgi:cbb3-type cytochrome oxidase maturation protein
MDLTWVTIAASLFMGLAALFLFVYAVKRGWFKDIEDAKYQVFWTDPERGNPELKKEGRDGGQSQTK